MSSRNNKIILLLLLFGDASPNDFHTYYNILYHIIIENTRSDLSAFMWRKTVEKRRCSLDREQKKKKTYQIEWSIGGSAKNVYYIIMTNATTLL